MSKMIQIRNVPDELHKKFKLRATMEGKSLSDYLLDELRASAAKPTMREFFDSLSQRSSVASRVSSSQMLRSEREGR